jgi:hypothetical protein
MPQMRTQRIQRPQETMRGMRLRRKQTPKTQAHGTNQEEGHQARQKRCEPAQKEALKTALPEPFFFLSKKEKIFTKKERTVGFAYAHPTHFCLIIKSKILEVIPNKIGLVVLAREPY